ncbi:hypothetical protein OG906_21150 [Streptomyces sp. NBC_01426]|uniref:hypothetical protein n=1 Tax=Streptomyces sp. NBC_01426 TaxID=2975866 RepID=UPI002E37AE85|nr:hypothetical protein [Streptomyces sp. NBC_01426]
MTSTSLIFGFPVAVVALGVAILSLLVALIALIWQVTKHVLDGGRVRVHLNAAILEPKFQLATNKSGKFEMPAPGGIGLLRPQNIEVAQLVVENPGRTAVTIHGPTLAVSGVGGKSYSISPRKFAWDGDGADDAITTSAVRVDPYSRVTFLLDYWSVVPRLHQQASGGSVRLRGMVNVGGRRRASRSSRRLAWRIEEGAWTVLADVEEVHPYTVMWRELYRAHGRIDQRDDLNGPSFEVLESAIYRIMEHFDEKPAFDELLNALRREEESMEGEVFSLSMLALDISNAFDFHAGRLGKWPSSGRAL